VSFEACLLAVRAAVPDLTDREVEELFSELERARQVKLASGQARDLAEATRLAAADLVAQAQLAAKVKERESLLNEAKTLQLVAYAKAQFADNPWPKARSPSGRRAERQGRRAAQRHDRAARRPRGVRGRHPLRPRRGGRLQALRVERDGADVAKALRAMDSGVPAKVPPEAQKMAEIIRKWQEKSRGDLNAEGAWVGKLSDYVTRQSHDVTLLRKAAGLAVKADDPAHFAAWRDFIRPLLDETRTPVHDDFPARGLRGPRVGRSPENRRRYAVRLSGPRNMAKKVSAERVLHFKDSDAWLAYNKRFGSGTLSESVVHSLELAAQNVGLMRVFGTNPRSVLKAGDGAPRRRAARDPEQVARLQRATPRSSG
jgi:hypothetical protein